MRDLRHVHPSAGSQPLQPAAILGVRFVDLIRPTRHDDDIDGFARRWFQVVTTEAESVADSASGAAMAANSS